jgi:hypothetical protein
LRPGGPLHLRDNITAEELFPWYKKIPAFQNVVLGQFKARLKDHRKVAAKESQQAMQEEMYMVHAMAHYLRQTHNEKGDIVFDMHPSKLLLREDIKANLHLTTYKTHGKLKASRTEDHPFDPKVFSDRVCQEIKRNKYFHYLELRREKLRNGRERTEETEEEAEETEEAEDEVEGWR